MTRSVISAAFLAMLLGFSCTPESPPADLEPPPTPVLTAESRWAVVNESYVKVLYEPEEEAAVTIILRRGDIVEVLSKVGKPDGRTYWLEIADPENGASGWVPDAELDVYDSPDRARTASARLSE